MSDKINIQICKHALDMLLERNGRTKYVKATNKGTYIYKCGIVNNLDECKFIGNRIVWRILKSNMKSTKRWRNHSLDEKITYRIFDNKVEITIVALQAKGVETFNLI
jgi:hypothetical protein